MKVMKKIVIDNLFSLLYTCQQINIKELPRLYTGAAWTHQEQWRDWPNEAAATMLKCNGANSG